MLAKLNSKNQLTLPKAIIDQFGPIEYFEIETRDGQIVLSPVRIQRVDAVRTRLAQLSIGEADVEEALRWARAKSKKRT